MEIQEQPVVVGYDGSEEAREALRFGAELARLHEWPLRVVIARGDLHRLSAWADGWTRGLAQEWADEAGKLLAEGRAEAAVVVDGLTTQVLVEESSSAAAVLVGASGHGAVTGRLQGSVSQHVCRHAASPVVVVRGGGRAEGPLAVGVDGSGTSLRALEVGRTNGPAPMTCDRSTRLATTLQPTRSAGSRRSTSKARRLFRPWVPSAL